MRGNAGQALLTRAIRRIATRGLAWRGPPRHTKPRNIVNIEISIAGVSPLLQNKFHDGAQIQASSGTSGAMIGDRGTPLEQAKLKLYTDLEGKPCIPQPNLFRCLIDAGAFFKAGKSKITTQKTSMIPACVEIQGVTIRLQHKEPWTVDSRPVRNPSTGGRFLCHRPCFNDWKLTFTVRIDTSMISAKLLRELVDAAGKRIGLGDFRPSCKGPFGKFVVVAWKETI